MSQDLAAARYLVESFRSRAPDACRLAVATCLAIKVEPALLRRARLELTPELDAGTLSDVWFSPLVGSRSSRAIVFEPDVLAVLREELIKKCDGDPALWIRHRQ